MSSRQLKVRGLILACLLTHGMSNAIAQGRSDNDREAVVAAQRARQAEQALREQRSTQAGADNSSQGWPIHVTSSQAVPGEAKAPTPSPVVDQQARRKRKAEAQTMQGKRGALDVEADRLTKLIRVIETVPCGAVNGFSDEACKARDESVQKVTEMIEKGEYGTWRATFRLVCESTGWLGAGIDGGYQGGVKKPREKLYTEVCEFTPEEYALFSKENQALDAIALLSAKLALAASSGGRGAVINSLKYTTMFTLLGLAAEKARNPNLDTYAFVFDYIQANAAFSALPKSGAMFFDLTDNLADLVDIFERGVQESAPLGKLEKGRTDLANDIEKTKNWLKKNGAEGESVPKVEDLLVRQEKALKKIEQEIEGEKLALSIELFSAIVDSLMPDGGAN